MKKLPAVSFLLLTGLGLQALFSTGCASGYTRPVGVAQAPAFRASPQNPVANVAVELTPAVKDRLKDSLKFDSGVLKEKVELALRNDGLLDKTGANAATLDILVTDVRVRNTFNAVMWGFMSGNDHIKGDVTIKDDKGTVLDTFHVDTSYALGGWAGGQDSARMNWLYEAFAKQVVSALTGEAKKK